MDSFLSLGQGFLVALEPSKLVFAAIGVLLGTAIGVLPGIGPVATVGEQRFHGVADKAVDDVAQQFEPDQRRLPKPSFIQLGSQRRGADLAQFEIGRAHV